ncbi:MAG: molybdopterin-dependent oxidoreductase [Blastocatellia bacterium]|nr:molybdopterin-dependent oxidoreductase [Blastocatellia bacterium]MDW8167810.1 molybdopterin-dependent oxidoreductase [Acidobacteriota bacterium]
METVKVVINGKEVEAPKGKLLLEVCFEAGFPVPNFCYYKDLPPQAACRMCLVRIEKMGRLQTACTVRVSDGMVVTTESEEIRRARVAMVDFILSNHPLDCPVCDKGGECELQWMAMNYGDLLARFDEQKDATGEYPLSPFIWLDPQRCILCYRCIRVCDEWVGNHALGVRGRGAHSVIVGNRADGTLECENCGNCVEVCPVGALTSANFRFRARPWDIRDTVTTCTYCSDGCQLRLSVRDGRVVRAWAKDLTKMDAEFANKVLFSFRTAPETRHNWINEEFLCLKGRYGNEFVNSPERLTVPLVRRNGRLEPTSWEEALKYVAHRLLEIKRRYGPESIACIGSPRLTNEDLYILAKFGRQVVETPHVTHAMDFDWRPFFKRLTVPLLTRPALREQMSTILLLGGNPPEYQPMTAYSLRAAVHRRGARLYIVGARPISRLQVATRFFHIRPGSEPAVLLALLDEGEIERAAEATQLTREELQELRRIVWESDRLALLVSCDVTGPALEAAAVLGGLVQAKGGGIVRVSPLLRFNNSLGALDMGLVAELPTPEHVGPQIKALYLMGSDLVRFYGEAWREALMRAELVVAHELFLTRTAELAHVVLPAMSFAELDGTFTNNAGQVQRIRRALSAAGDWRPDWMIIEQIAAKMGADLGCRYSVVNIFREIAETIPGYQGITYARLNEEGAIQTERPLLPLEAIDQTRLLERLRAQVETIDRTAERLHEPAPLGVGLFEPGTLTEHVPLLRKAFGWGMKEPVEAAR